MSRKFLLAKEFLKGVAVKDPENPLRKTTSTSVVITLGGNKLLSMRGGLISTSTLSDMVLTSTSSSLATSQVLQRNPVKSISAMVLTEGFATVVGWDQFVPGASFGYATSTDTPEIILGNELANSSYGYFTSTQVGGDIPTLEVSLIALSNMAYQLPVSSVFNVFLMSSNAHPGPLSIGWSVHNEIRLTVDSSTPRSSYKTSADQTITLTSEDSTPRSSYKTSADQTITATSEDATATVTML